MSHKEIKYLTKRQIIEINDAAIREKRNTYIKKDFLEKLPEDIFYPIIHFMYHAKNEVRITIKFKDKGKSASVDMSIMRYNTIPTAKIYDNGTVKYEDDKMGELKRPYPDRRPWEEKIVLKPVRKQGKFRREVLKAYEYQCAVCTINEPKMLRAAHILPVVDGNDDTVNNGICLCVNHEVAFDMGILRITPEGNIIVMNNENIKVDYKRIRFPQNKEWYPSYDKLKQRFDGYKK